MYHHSSDSSQFVDIESVFYLAPGEMYWKDLNLVYLGCNRNFLNLTGFKDIKDVVGKTDYDMPWGNSPQLVEKYINDDRYVIETKNKLFTEDQSVITRSGVQVKIFVKTAKAPLFDKDGNVIGVLGLAINITEDKEKEQLEIENQAYMIRAQQDEKFREVIGRAVHDIRAPITSTLAIAKTATELREELRVTLRNAANRINDIANNLLNHYKPDTSDVRIEDKKVPLLLSGAIKEILSEKRAQYHDLALIFEEDVNENSHFAFIEIEIEAFKRTLSNLINNSVDALDKKTGIITVGLKCEANKVKLSIKDNGKGIKPEVLDKIKNNISITDGKKDGHGIGLRQVRETLQKNNGNITISSSSGNGTEIILTFPRVKTPNWIATEISLNSDDIIVILDDDASIHGAWDARFAQDAAQFKIKHFDLGEQTIEFINSLTPADKDRVFLLTDYELLQQGLHGLDVVEQTKVKRSILVTSHHEDSEIHKQAHKTNTKILPKLLASEIPIIVPNKIDISKNKLIDTNQQSQQNEGLRKVEMVIVDDYEEFTNMLKNTVLKNANIDIYNDLQGFVANVKKYPKDTKMLLDNNFDNYYGEIKGIGAWGTGFSLANYLHEKGFSNLYLFSGDKFTEVPPYLKIINKASTEDLENLIRPDEKRKSFDMAEQLVEAKDIFTSSTLHKQRYSTFDVEDKVEKLKRSRSQLSRNKYTSQIEQMLDNIGKTSSKAVVSIFTAENIFKGEASLNDLVECEIKNGINEDKIRRILRLDFHLLATDEVKDNFKYTGNEIIVDVILFTLIKYAVYQIKQGHGGNIYLSIKKSGKFNKLSVKYIAKGVNSISPDQDKYYAENYAHCKRMMEFFEGTLTTNIIDNNSVEFVLSFPKIDNV